MRVKDILHHKGAKVISVSENDLVRDAVHLMQREHIGAVAVLNKLGELRGMLSEREVVRSLAREPDRALRLRCADIMLRDTPVCTPQTSIRDLAKTMTLQRARHIPVLEANTLLGVISIGDITKAQLDETQLENGVLHDLLRASRFATA